MRGRRRLRKKVAKRDGFVGATLRISGDGPILSMTVKGNRLIVAKAAGEWTFVSRCYPEAPLRLVRFVPNEVTI